MFDGIKYPIKLSKNESNNLGDKYLTYEINSDVTY